MNKTILIVDDSLTVRADLEEAFTAAGMTTICCASATAARVALATRAIGLVILDVVLPDGDGIELLKEFRAKPWGANLPVLMLSTEAEVKDRIRGLLTGSSDYVGKPYERDYVVARAAQLLAQTYQPEQLPTRPVVLIIDDSVTFREKFGELLKEQGYDVMSAASGEEGLRSAAVHRPAAIMIDAILPGIDGQTVIGKLRLDVALRHTPCILLTSTESQGSELHALDSGADAFVRKEQALDMMLARVIAVLRKIDNLGPRNPTASLLSPKRILAVDDSLTYLNELNTTLIGEGYDVILAHSGEEALDMLSVQSVDCILLDRLMPGIDGTETCRRIKASPSTRDIPLIMLTAMENQEAMIEGLSTGADDYVLKSNELDVLKARVRAQLRRKQFEEESRRVRAELMNKELEAAEARAARELAQSRAELMSQLKQNNQDLQQVVAQLHEQQREIAEKNRQLEQANRLKSEFLSHMSHEIRTPMNAILGFAYLLDQRQLEGDTGDLIKKIRNAGRTLQSIINDILDFSKIEAGHLEIEHAPFRLSSIIDDLSDIMAANAGNKDLEMVISPPPALGGQLYGDAVRLEQILINLSANAIKFSQQGNIQVAIDLLARSDHSVTLRFSVSDTGIGIPLDKQAQIFDAFAQADASTTRLFGGTGLGLSICRHLVNMMGGKIGVTSEVGRGSQFWFSIPFAWRAGEQSAVLDVLRLEVLIVDDNAVALDNISLIASALGWNVVKARSGKEAINEINARRDNNGHFDVLLLDWDIADMDGLNTAITLRETLQQTATPIVLMTNAFSHDELQRQAHMKTIDGMICKPLTSNRLYNSVTEVLRQTEPNSPVPLHKMKQRLLGVRILIVDDNEINREVAILIVRAEGAIVSIAYDGKNAVDWLCANPERIDIVLMDVQMPVMDGYEATRQLRALPQFAQLPIVALSAGAFKAQQDTALRTGMNAFVSKPFNVDELVTTILQLCHRQAQPPTPEPLQTPAQNWNSTFDDKNYPGMALNKGLDIWKNLQTYRNFLLKFCADFANCSKLLADFHAAADQKAAAKLLHKLKGVAGNLALDDVARLAAQAEVSWIGSQDEQALQPLCKALEITFASIASFAAATAVQTEPMPLSASSKHLPALLESLLRALNADTPENVRAILASLSALLAADAIAQLQTSVENLDFQGAQVIVRRLAQELDLVLSNGK